MANENRGSNICHFTFIAASSEATIHVTGVERSWDYLKLEFDRHSDGLFNKETKYYQTLYAGPRIFAVDDQNKVYYHEQEKWIEYISSRDVRYSYDPDFEEVNEFMDEDQTIIEPQHIPINAQWYVKNAEPHTRQNNPWQPYSDVDNEIIEESFQKDSKTTILIELDDYLIDLQQKIQINKLDPTQQHAIKRIELIDDQCRYRLRERFSEPLHSITDTSRTYGKVHEWCPFLKQWMETKIGKQCIFNTKVCVRKAIEGILIEGRLIGKSIEAKKIVEPLAMYHGMTAYEVSTYCVRMFTRESFLYRLVNKILRENDTSKIDTLGPYCYLLRAYIRRIGTDYSGTLFRGCNLSEDQIDQYREAAITKDWKVWTSFTSTSKNPAVAQAFQQNTRFIFNVEPINMFLVRAFDIQNLSINLDEEEVLLPAGVLFQVQSVERSDNEDNNKWIIKIKL